MKKDSGFVEYSAVLLLFFIGVLITGIVLFTSSAINFTQANSRDFDNKLAADRLLDGIIEKMQALTLHQYDYRNNAVIQSLMQEYAPYRLEFIDISSGFNLNFISDTDIIDTNIARLLFSDNTGTAFITWRNANGLSASKEVWREFIREEVWDSCVSFGWLHRNDLDSFAFRTISASFGITDPDELFPLVNDFPRMNVNMVNPDILRPLIIRSSFRVERANERANELINRLRNSPVMHADISSILRIPTNHPLMSYFGTRTAFWKIRFTMPSSLEVEAVVAAIPQRDGGVQDIELYRLINRRFL
ncbi:MAG: hypothetical protein FWC97_01105 [Treponema sp.]|nr:hypothetical protein [Treponema sp.]